MMPGGAGTSSPAARLAALGLSGGLVVALAVAVAPLDAHGQAGEPPSDKPAAAAGDTEVAPLGRTLADDAGVYGNIDASKVPDDEKKAQTEKMLVDQRAALARISQILGEARASKDIVQLNCVNEKLTQVKGLLRISEQASVQMYESLATSARDIVNHEYTKMVVAHQKSQALRTEAEQCVGENSVYTGDTLVDVEIEQEGEGGGGFGDEDARSAAAPPPGPAVPPVASTF